MALTKGQPCDASSWQELVAESNTLHDTVECLAAHESWQVGLHAPAGSPTSPPAAAAAATQPSASQAYRTTKLPNIDPAASTAPATASETSRPAIEGGMTIKTLTAPAPTGTAPDIAGRYSAFLDPNLIIWDNDSGNAAFWIDPNLHLDQTSLLELADAYPSAEVFIETDCDEDGCPAKSCDQHAVLEDLDADALRQFALAGIIDTMAFAVQCNLAVMAVLIAGGQFRVRPGGFWSRRLVYRRSISPDTLMGCVQVHWHLATHDLIPLIHSLARRSAQIRLPQVPQPCTAGQALGKSVAYYLEVQTRSAGPASLQPAAAAQPQRDVAMADPAAAEVPPASSDRSFKMPEREMSPPATPEGSDLFHAGTSDSLLPATAEPEKPSEPSIAASASSHARVPDASAELLKKLREAQQQVEVKYSRSHRAERDRYDRDLLAHEKSEDRNRQAWAKLGKEPPPPKLTKGKWEITDAHVITAIPPAAGSMQEAPPVRPPSHESRFGPAAGDLVRVDKLPAQPAAADPIAAGRAMPTPAKPKHTLDSKDTFQPAPSMLASEAPDCTPTNAMLSQVAACAIPGAPAAKRSSADSVVSRHMPSTVGAADAMPAPDDIVQAGFTAEGLPSVLPALTEEEKELSAAQDAKWNRIKKDLVVAELFRRHDLMDKEEAEAQAHANADALMRQV